jgi:hypothetical protein
LFLYILSSNPYAMASCRIYEKGGNWPWHKDLKIRYTKTKLPARRVNPGLFYLSCQPKPKH